MKKILWICAALAAGAYICGPIVDPDLWWHITVGRWIFGHDEIPTQEHWNMFALGEPWRAYSWLPELLFAWVDRHFGDQGLITLQILSGLFLSFTCFYVYGRVAKDWFLGGLLGMYTVAACVSHFNLRPQTFVWGYFAWLLYLLVQIERSGLNKRRALGVVLVMALWANTHITTILGIITILAWLMNAGPRLALKVAALGFLGTLCTPYLGGEWLTFLSKSGHPLELRTIAEFRAATIMDFAAAFLILLSALALALWHEKPRVVEAPKLLITGIFIVISLAVVKFIPFAVVLLASVVALYFERTAGSPKALGNLGEALWRLRDLFHKIPREGLSFLFLAAAVVCIYKAWSYPISQEKVPVQAVDFMIKEGLPHPILNDFGAGGYMMYRYSNQRGELKNPVPIDGRTNVVPHAVWEKFRKSYHGRIGWQEYFDLVKPKTVLWKTESPLVPILIATGEWCQVFRSGKEDQGFSVLLKKSEHEARLPILESVNCS